MPLFALPLAPSSTTSHSQPTNTRIHSALAIRKRKRRSPPRSPSESSLSDHDAPPASTNPLSLAPDEVLQYRLAGLELDEGIPQVKNWPHRGLGVGLREKGKKGKGKGNEKVGEREDDIEEEEQLDKGDSEEGTEKKRVETGPRLRLQHLSVLTTILHRCLLEGDIRRASRAWAMLIRTQVGGMGMDLRGSGYWGIGAELLIRSHDRKMHYSYDSESESDEEEEGGLKRWGSAEGLEKAKDYYERLILQYPYKRQFGTSVNALDFWPAMIGCEIYGIQFEQNEALRSVAIEEDNDDGAERSGSESDESQEEQGNEEDVDGAFDADQRRKTRRYNRRAERRWNQRDEIRKTALTASEKIAARLDDVMQTPPYSDSHNLLRLRGMIALYIGDLSMPETPPEQEIRNGDNEEALKKRSQGRGADEDAERRFLYRQRLADHERGKQQRKEEQERARALFARIARDGGNVDDIKDLPLDQDEPPEDDADFPLAQNEAQEEFYDAEE